MSHQQKITVGQAKEEGYKFCVPQFQESNLIPLEKVDLERHDLRYVLIEKEPRPFQIDPDTILDLLNDYVDGQEEVDNEDGHINEVIASIDYSEITKKINDLLAEKTKYFFATDILLVKENL